MTRQHILAPAVALIAAASLPGTWSNGPPLPVARSEVAVATLRDTVYAIGGYANGNVDQRLVEVFDTKGGAWHDAAPLPRGLNHVGAVGFRGKIYTFGGFAAQNNAAVSDANVYDPSTNRWTSIAPLPRPLGSVSVAVLGSQIHLVGGRDTHSVRSHYVYDPPTNTYTVRAPLPVGRDHMGLVAYGEKIYAIGGRIDIGGEARGMATAYTTNEGYDPVANRWSEYAPLPQGRHGTGAAVVNGRLYVPAGAPVPGGSRQSNTLFIFTE
jgi:N-acetylneuraminic acid mutarotase